MKQIAIEVADVNMAALDYNLRATLGNRFDGLTHDGKLATLILDDATTADQIRQARTIVADHDPAQLSPNQQAEVTRAAKLEQMRRDYTAVDFDLSAYGSQPALIQKMAQKIAWMEQEINQLRSRING